ncbi:TPA: hypothetical protein ACF2D8_005052 [Serratia marcescens]
MKPKRAKGKQTKTAGGRENKGRKRKNRKITSAQGKIKDEHQMGEFTQ